MDLTALIAQAPKIALHDHLDGGLRPQTIVDLAEHAGVDLPTKDPTALGQWFFDQADSGSLAQYLTTFAITVGVMQTYDNIRRVAKEFVLDQAADGVVYAEARWAPAQHLRGGLSLEDAVRAVRDGLNDGMDEARRAGTPVIARQLLCELRSLEPTTDIAQLAIAYRDDSVAGMDCAGPEDGFSSAVFIESYTMIHAADMLLTIHAGEADGISSIQEALQICGAHRIGHGVRLIDDIDMSGRRPVLGRVAQYIATLRIPLEVSPTSNIQTGVAQDIAHHPFDALYRAGIRVTVNCDNRLMSRTTLTQEFSHLAAAFGYGMADVEKLTLNAAKSVFLPLEDKLALIHDIVLPGFADLEATR